MDHAVFTQAEEQYEAGDYRAAARLYLAAAGGDAAGNGVCYHRAGNCLMRLHRERDALKVYAHALKDELYEQRGAVLANLGAAHASLGEYSEAVRAYEGALDEHGYTTRYKALQGLAGALWEMGRYADAAREYRKAALEGGNPDPGKALNNLGLCFLHLGRPDDAAEAFKAAVGLPQYTNKGRAQANLGLALSEAGRHAEAVRAFEKATQLYGHSLSAEAVEAFEASRAALVPETPPRETVEGWETGDLGGAAEALRSSVSEDHPVPGDPGTTGEFGTAADVSEFFARTDDEMKQIDRDARRQAREDRRGGRSPWAVVAVVAGAAFLAASLLVAAYFLGLGWPTQSMAVEGMMDAYAAGKSVDRYWVAVPSSDIKKEMQKVTPNHSGYTIDSVDRASTTSRASITVAPAKGAAMHYVVTLSREGVGWKVTGIENDWGSTGGS